MKPMLIFVSGPYRADTQVGVAINIYDAGEIAKAIWQKGHYALCPHMNSAHMDGIVPDEQFLAGDLVMLSKCDAVCLVDGWSKSVGAVAEVKLARRLGIHIYGSVDGILGVDDGDDKP